MTKSPRKGRLFFTGALLILLYAVLSVLVSWPLAANLSEKLPSNSDDTLVHYWNGWSVQRALRDGRSPYYTNLIFYPDGISLITHNLAWFQILPWMILEPLLGGITAYNLSLLLNLTLCGCTAFLFAYHLTRDLRAAFLAGLIYLAWPYRTSQLDHPNLIATQWIPIFLLFLSLTLREGKWGYGVLTGLSFALVGYTRWQLLLPATFVGLIYALFRAGDWLPREKWPVAGRLVVALVIASAALLPPLLFLLNQQSEGDTATDLLREGEETVMQTDLLAFGTPGPSHPLLHQITQPRYERYYPDRAPHRRSPAYLGGVALLLAALGLVLRTQSSLPWLVAALVLASLALGSLLRIDGQFHPAVPMPYTALPLVRLMRVPDRFNMFIALPVAVMAAYGTAGILARWQRNWATILLLPAFSALIILEYIAIPVPVGSMPNSSFYSQLAQEPGEFALLNLPIDPLRAKIYMFQQLQHKRPILMGKIARLPDDAYAYIDQNPWLRSLRLTQEMDPYLTDVSRQLGHLAEDGVRYILIHKRLVGADRIAHWQRYLLAQPRYEDDRLIVYTTHPEAGRDFNLRDELVPGLGPVRTIVSADCLPPGRMLEVDVGWGSRRALSQDFDVEIALADEEGTVRQSQRFPLADWPSHQWPADALAWGYYPLRLSPTLPEGEYTIRLTLLDGETEEKQGTPLVVQTLRVQSAPCPVPSVATAATVANAYLGDDLHLLGYQVERNESTLLFTLHWRAQRRIPLSYKVFIHVYDPATDIPVAQDDAEPHRGGYPTQFWAPGEIVADRIPVYLNDVPPGAYGVAIGVYDPASGTRLPVVDQQGQPSPDGRLILPETIEIAPP
jgi:hypothetical protein